MEAVEDTVVDLGAMPPPRHHFVDEMDVMLGRLRCAGEVCLPVARAYGDYCAKVAWTTAFASLDKVGCGHLDTLATCSTLLVTIEEVAAGHRHTRKASNVFIQDF